MEATKELKPGSYNENAQKPYNELTDEQKFIDEFICEKIKQRIRSACIFYLKYEHKSELLFKEKREIWNEFRDYVRFSGFDLINKPLSREYNEWLFERSFRDVLKKEELE